MFEVVFSLNIKGRLLYDTFSCINICLIDFKTCETFLNNSLWWILTGHHYDKLATSFKGSLVEDHSLLLTGIYIYCKALPILKVTMISLLNILGYIPDSIYEASSERWGMLFLYVSKDHGLL